MKVMAKGGTQAANRMAGVRTVRRPKPDGTRATEPTNHGVRDAEGVPKRGDAANTSGKAPSRPNRREDGRSGHGGALAH